MGISHKKSMKEAEISQLLTDIGLKQLLEDGASFAECRALLQKEISKNEQELEFLLNKHGKEISELAASLEVTNNEVQEFASAGTHLAQLLLGDRGLFQRIADAKQFQVLSLSYPSVETRSPGKGTSSGSRAYRPHSRVQDGRRPESSSDGVCQDPRRS